MATLSVCMKGEMVSELMFNDVLVVLLSCNLWLVMFPTDLHSMCISFHHSDRLKHFSKSQRSCIMPDFTLVIPCVVTFLNFVTLVLG